MVLKERSHKVLEGKGETFEGCHLESDYQGVKGFVVARKGNFHRGVNPGGVEMYPLGVAANNAIRDY